MTIMSGSKQGNGIEEDVDYGIRFSDLTLDAADGASAPLHAWLAPQTPPSVRATRVQGASSRGAAVERRDARYEPAPLGPTLRRGNTIARQPTARRQSQTLSDARAEGGPSVISSAPEVTDDEVYFAALGIAYLVHILQPRDRPGVSPQNARRTASYTRSSEGLSSVSSTPQSTGKSSLLGKRHSRAQFSISSLSDVFAKSSSASASTSAKLPKNFLKVLKSRLESIAKGSDEVDTVHNQDHSLRAITGVFYGKFSDTAWTKAMKDNRSAEELILHWTTVVQAMLKKRADLPPEQSRLELDRLVIVFVSILIQCLQSKDSTGAQPEMIQRLEDYRAKLLGDEPSNGLKKISSHSTVASGPGATCAASHDDSPLAEMPLVKSVARLFHVSEARVAQDVAKMRADWTQAAALKDLKLMVSQLGQKREFPGRPEDFLTMEAYQQWLTIESKTLDQLMMTMMQINPDLLRTSEARQRTPEPQDGLGSRKSSGQADGLELRRDRSSTSFESGREIGLKPTHSRQTSHNLTVPPALLGSTVNGTDHFTFVPRAPSLIYTQLLDRCIENDLASFADLSPEDEVSTRILSKEHIALLNECGVRWRLGTAFRAVAFLDTLREKLDEGRMPMECLYDALDHVKKIIKDTSSYQMWPIEVQDSLCFTLLGLCMTLLGSMTASIRSETGGIQWDGYTEWIELIDSFLDSSPQSPWPLRQNDALIKELDLDFSQLEQAIADWASARYQRKVTSLAQARGSQDVAEAALDHSDVMTLIDWIRKSAKKALRDTPHKIFDRILPARIISMTQSSLFFSDLNALLSSLKATAPLNNASPERGEGPDTPNQDMWSIFFELKELRSIIEEICPDEPLAEIDVEVWFLPSVQAWLSSTALKTHQWVLNAIRADAFAKIDDDTRHSTSVVDLFSSFNQAHNFIEELNWPEALQHARFLTDLAKTFTSAIEEYCDFMRDMFSDEMYQVEKEPLPARQLAWLAKARQTLQEIQGDRKIEPFHFSAGSCIKLNNVEAAKTLLDNLYQSMGVDEAAIVASRASPSMRKAPARASSLWTIKLLEAQNLKSSKRDGILNSYVVLTNQAGQRVAKTRMICDTLDPKWKEAFDISSQGPLWLTATVWDQDTKADGEHHVCGRSFIQLDPSHYEDFLVHEKWLDLDSGGRVLLQASMEGEKDDIQFYFGRAFRTLERTRDEMLRTIADRMSTTIRQCLSRRLLRSLLNMGLDNMEKAITGVTALYQSAREAARAGKYTVMSAGSASPRLGAVNANGGSSVKGLSDVEVEKAIGPLLDYFDLNLKLLNEHLYDEVFDALMIRVWKEVVLALEELLVPPLSDTPSLTHKALIDKEVDVVYKWLSFLKNYFHHNGDGVSMDDLSTPKYRDLMIFRLYYDMDTDTLMQECVHSLQKQLAANRWPSMRRKLARDGSVMNHKNLGTMRRIKALQKQEFGKRPDIGSRTSSGGTTAMVKDEQDYNAINNGEIILRILRMRPNTGAFLKDQMRMMTYIKQQVKIRPSANAHH